MLLANLKVTLKSMIVNPMTAIMMVLFPILMVFVLSMSQEGMYAHDIKDLNITYRIIDEDKTQLSQNLGYAFQSPQLHGVVKQSDEPDFTITIPKGYNEALLKKRICEFRSTASPMPAPIKGNCYLRSSRSSITRSKTTWVSDRRLKKTG